MPLVDTSGPIDEFLNRFDCELETIRPSILHGYRCTIDDYEFDVEEVRKPKDGNGGILDTVNN